MKTSQSNLIESELKRFVEKKMAELTLGVEARLKSAPPEGGTPVDTGWARANWIPNIGVPVRIESERPSDAGEISSGISSRTSAAESNGLQIAASFRIEQGPLFVSNNVPYIGLLNDGSSAQAPAAFVQRAIRTEIQAVTNKAGK